VWWEFESWYGQEFSLLHVIQISSGDHTASYPMVVAGLFSRVKRPGREADNSPPTSAEAKKKCASVHLVPHTTSWLSAQLSTRTTLSLRCCSSVVKQKFLVKP
jgi:hypothetical protein